jgi:S1 RNA binding domain/Zc3h12a-like Ribonuclease NYN domain
MPRHVVVDGSNLATEGRSLPSLKQLNEAVLAFMEEHPDDVITVVVDATFGHRIDPREVAEFDAAIENNELVAPPAGAIGRGDAFVLTIANKVQATILSNDSYQEFHGGDYDWLFDEGRLIGGKPVPNVGWVFVPRVPVRGPVSRRAVKDARKTSKAPARPSSRVGRTGGRASKEASLPMPVPTAPPPAAKGRSGSRSAAAAAVAPDTGDETAAAPEPARAPRRPKPAEQTDAPTAARPHMVNDLLPFLGFVERHPVGSSVTAIVESYSSHGAYVTLGEARGYVPLRLMAEPVPRSAREVMKVGEEVELVVVSFNATRRSIDLCVPGMEPAEVKALVAAPTTPAPAKRSRKKAAAPAPAPPPAEVAAEPAAEPAAATPAPAKRTRKKAAAAAPVEPPPVPAKRTRKKASPPAPVPPQPAAVEPAVVEPPAQDAPAPAKKAATSRPRKKAVAPPDAPTSLDGSEAAPESPRLGAEPAPPAPAKRTRKKAVPA